MANPSFSKAKNTKYANPTGWDAADGDFSLNMFKSYEIKSENQGQLSLKIFGALLAILVPSCGPA